MNNHTHSYWLDFQNDVVRCSRFKCKQKVGVADALTEADPRFSLEVAHGKLKGHDGKVYVIKVNGEYICSITGYTRGVLHLSDSVKPDHREFFYRVVSKCFGVNLIQIDEELKNESKSL